MVDGDYNFLYVNVGTNGRSNDAAIFSESKLYAALENGSLNMPSQHVILGDSAFPLKPYLMKPYGSRKCSAKQSVFNYRLSRARRIVENAFGILTWRFHVFTHATELKTSTVDSIVLAACSLHNWLRATNPSYITTGVADEEDENTGEIIPGLWRQEVQELMSMARPRSSNNYSRAAEIIRSQYTDFFWEEGVIRSQ